MWDQGNVTCLNSIRLALLTSIWPNKFRISQIQTGWWHSIHSLIEFFSSTSHQKDSVCHLNSSELCAAMAHSLTNSIHSFSHFIPRFFMSMTIKRHREETKPSTRCELPQDKKLKKKKNRERITQQLFWNKNTGALTSTEFLNTLTANARVKRATGAPTVNRAIKGEVLHSRRNTLLYPFAVSRPFIHWNICTSTTRDRPWSLRHRHSGCVRGENKPGAETEGGKKKISSHEYAPKMCIIYCHDITHEFYAVAPVKVSCVCVYVCYEIINNKEHQNAESRELDTPLFCPPSSLWRDLEE